MEFDIQKDVLVEALSKVQSVVDKKGTLNSLSHVRVDAVAEDSVEFMATNYEVTVIAHVPAEVAQPGSAGIAGGRFYDVARVLAPGKVSVQTSPEHWAEIRAGRSRFRIGAIGADDFPAVGVPEDARILRLSGSVLVDLLAKTTFSVSTEPIREQLNGVLFQVRPGADGVVKLTAVSTDGHRLSHTEAIVEDAAYDGEAFDVIVHRAGLNEVRRVAEATAGPVEMGVPQGGRSVFFRTPDDTVIVRQIEAEFPDYERVIPRDTRHRVVIPVQAFHDALRRVGILMTQRMNVTRLSFEADTLRVAAQNPDAGEAVDEVDVEYTGEPFEVGFNHKYLLDFLPAVDAERVVFGIDDPMSAGIFEDADNPQTLFVVMPVRV